MSETEAKIGGVAAAALLIGYAIYANADTIKQFLIWALIGGSLIAIVVGGIAFYFWQRSTKRSTHPWE
jgi:hypothetical protein